jgi:hypothetical protein
LFGFFHSQGKNTGLFIFLKLGYTLRKSIFLTFRCLLHQFILPLQPLHTNKAEKDEEYLYWRLGMRSTVGTISRKHLRSQVAAVKSQLIAGRALCFGHMHMVIIILSRK